MQRKSYGNRGVEDLQTCLQSLPKGPVPERDKLIGLLEDIWRRLPGHNAEGMTPDKLFRAEDMEWDPPMLKFRIERHGRTALGSTRADMYLWTLDVSTMTVDCTRKGYRQVAPREPPVNVRRMAVDIKTLILAHAEDPRLRWLPRGHVRVRIAEVLPPGVSFKRTMASRRKRFWLALEEEMKAAGWVRLTQSEFAPSVKGQQAA